MPTAGVALLVVLAACTSGEVGTTSGPTDTASPVDGPTTGIGPRQPVDVFTQRPPTPDCHPSYEGVCLDPNSYDYDCEGGEGDGPDYTPRTGFRVVGPDVYELDREGDGFACEPY